MSYWRPYPARNGTTNWQWVDGNPPAEGEFGYPASVLTDHNQIPPDYVAPHLPDAPNLPIPDDVNIPVVKYEADWLPTYDGDFYFEPGPPSDTPIEMGPPSSPAYHVLLSSLRVADAKISTALGNAINGKDGYTELKEYLDRVKHWIFYRPEHSPLTDGEFIAFSGEYSSYNPDFATQFVPGQTLTEDQKHAPPTQASLDSVKMVDNVMMSLGDLFMAGGMYLQRVYEIAQSYVKADKDSYFPDL
jgi:hypothetical protein